MSLSSHIEELRKKHQTLSNAVEDAMKHPAYNVQEVAELKKQKLQLKEEISRLTAH